MNDNAFNSADLMFKANQIVCLEHQDKCLYGEVIQLIPHRELCWFRPMCLVILENERAYSDLKPKTSSSLYGSSTTDTQIIDLQSGSDLLWPVDLFRLALDTEAIQFLSRLKDPDRDSIDKKLKQKCLNKFVQKFWQANQDKF